jgi:aspartate kinase
MRILVQKFGGTSVDSDEHRQMAATRVARAVQNGWSVVVVVSAIGRQGAPYATDTLVNTLRNVDPSVPPSSREMDLLMACGEIISTVVMAQTLRAMGFDTVALTGGQAGIATDYDFGNARILSIDPSYVVRMLETGKLVLVAGFQGVTQHGAVTTLGRGGSDTTASALGAALKPYAEEVGVEIYTDVDGVKTADPRLVSDARTLFCASYEEVAEMAHMGAKSTFVEAPGTLIAGRETLPEEVRLRVTGVTHTGRIVYLRFELPTGDEDDKAVIELAIYHMLQREKISLYLNSTSGGAFSFAIAREHLGRIRDLLDGLVVPIKLGGRRRPPFGRVYRLGLGLKQSGFEAQQKMLEDAASFVELHTVEAEVTENCTVVSVIASRFTGVPGVIALILDTLAKANVPVFQTADSEFSISVLIPEGDAAKATLALHQVFGLKTAVAAA